MKKAGQIVLFKFPQTDLSDGKLRPALLISQTPGEYSDWLICMISSKMSQYIKGFDEIIKKNSFDYIRSGLKAESVVRATRLAVVSEEILLGTIGEISRERLVRIKNAIANWIKSV
ncbi:MAG: type II toxin-antitoxin system PemK/MazF family toxin [Calditrichaeota bacterium]|nr:type II toxin-antitoxin system PemK/MazF family toxin [Calditrichota bacterium]